MDRGLFESVPNFSEGSRPEVIAQVAGAAARAHVLDVDADADHNRVVISIAGQQHDLVDALVASVEMAVERIDIREHRGVHPRVGVADVVPVVPLGGATLRAAREIAHVVGDQIWRRTHVPVYFYGYAESNTLADIRAGRVAPALGDPSPHPTAGAVCVGARLPLVAFNVLLPDLDVNGARGLARSLRESTGGLRGVQALVFQLPGGRIQLSMNLFRLGETPPSAVISELERRGVSVEAPQIIGLCPAAVATSAASGRLLEAHLAAAAARRGAELSAAQGYDEHVRLAGRLEQTADMIGRAGIEPEQMLSSAEQAAALIPILKAAGVLTDELGAMLRIASRGLRIALAPGIVTKFATRVRALDWRLEQAGRD
ncbi:MAG: glutamate formiminotransferase [Chloroflexi bacterium]|nr:MAG: glutamate formiminotransferase [Chloroflexota bacterium]